MVAFALGDTDLRITYGTASALYCSSSAKSIVIAGDYPHELAKEVIASGVSAGEYQEVDIDTVAECIVGMLDSFVSGRACLDLEYATGEISVVVVDLLTRGLVKNRH